MQKKGRWLPLYTYDNYKKIIYRCSECNKSVMYKTNICPSCGADMIGAKKIKKYRRKKPIEVEAVQWTGDNLAELRKIDGVATIYFGDDIKIETLEGVITASIGDYIIKDMQGKLYSCKPEIFEQTYEEVIENE